MKGILKVTHLDENNQHEENPPYFIDIIPPEGEPESFSLTHKIIIGGSDGADIVFKDFELKDIHCILKSQNELLSINNFGEKGTTLLNDFPLLPGKMYILDHGDEISLGEIKFIIKRNDNFHKDKIKSIQIGDPKLLKQYFKIPIIYNFREKDIINGGNGAPLVPFLDWLLFRKEKTNTILINIGGISNISFIKPSNCLPE